MYEFDTLQTSFGVPVGLDASQIDLSNVNPYNRVLPVVQEGVLREVLYIQHIIRRAIPTSLPGDDFELISSCLKSLETRIDLSWRVYDETNIRSTILGASRRKENDEDKLIEEEGFSIHERLWALVDYWDSLSILPTRPEQWEEESDTTFIPPLDHNLSVGDGGEVNQEGEIYELSLTPEQSAAADQICQKWLKSHQRAASYFKDHPPMPIGWIAVPRSELSIRNDWATVLHDVKPEQPLRRKLAEDKAYKPIYEAYPLPPFGWRTPGVVDQRTDEDRQREWQEGKFKREQIRAREELQKSHLQQLRA